MTGIAISDRPQTVTVEFARRRGAALRGDRQLASTISRPATYGFDTWSRPQTPSPTSPAPAKTRDLEGLKEESARRLAGALAQHWGSGLVTAGDEPFVGPGGLFYGADSDLLIAEAVQLWSRRRVERFLEAVPYRVRRVVRCRAAVTTTMRSGGGHRVRDALIISGGSFSSPTRRRLPAARICWHGGLAAIASAMSNAPNAGDVTKVAATRRAATALKNRLA